MMTNSDEVADPIGPTTSLLENGQNSIGDACASAATASRVTVNVSGQRFVTYHSTLARLPTSRLARITTNDAEYDAQHDEFFFDRNPVLFPYILDGYRLGRIHFPHSTCTPSIKEELNFWELREELIATCCWKNYKEYEDDEVAVAHLEQNMKRVEAMKQSLHGPNVSAWQRWRTRVVLLLDEPSSSTAAVAYSWIYAFLLGMSLLLLMLGTEKVCRTRVNRGPPPTNMTNPKALLYWTTDENIVITHMSGILLCLFLLELILRFIVWPTRWRFLLNFFNAIDTFSIIPLVVISVSEWIQPGLLVKNGLVDIKLVLAVANVFRMLRVLKIVYHNRSLRVLVFALRASLQELLLLMLLVFIGMLIFSTTIYYAEFNQPNAFLSIPRGFWWSIITMTTVGYGDVYPESLWGYMIGGACAMTGMLIAGLPIPIIANNFNLYYSYAKLTTGKPWKQGVLLKSRYSRDQGFSYASKGFCSRYSRDQGFSYASKGFC